MVVIRLLPSPKPVRHANSTSVDAVVCDTAKRKLGHQSWSWQRIVTVGSLLVTVENIHKQLDGFNTLSHYFELGDRRSVTSSSVSIRVEHSSKNGGLDIERPHVDLKLGDDVLSRVIVDEVDVSASIVGYYYGLNGDMRTHGGSKTHGARGSGRRRHDC